MFGQTEINYIVGNCGRMSTRGAAAGWPARAGSMGRPYPGHRVAVIDDDGHECPRGTPGDVAVHRRDIHGDPDPVFFLGYWKQRRRDARQVHRRPRRQLVPHRRHRGDGRRRLPLVPGPQRRHVQGRRLPHRPERDRELPGQASGGGQRRGGAQARRRARRGGQGLRRAGAGLRRRRGAGRANCSSTCAASSRPTSTRRRSSSSTRCR